MSTAGNSGIDIDLGDRCSRTAYAWARRSFELRRGRDGEVIDLDASFSNGLRLGEQRLAMTSDGIGTKIELAERCGVYDTLGRDLVAMVVDDLVCSGAEPFALSNILDVDRLHEPTVDALMRGLHDAARVAEVAVVGGEIAELGARIGGHGAGMHFNWCATALGVVPAGRALVDGSRIEVGDCVLALASAGLRSNGFSLARRILQRAFGEAWHEARFDDGTAVGRALLEPSRIYCRGVLELLAQGLDLRGVAHITGGGIPSKFRRVLRPRGLGAVLDGLGEPGPALRALQQLGDVPARTAYTQWNMGTGMLLVLPADQAERALALLAARGLPGQRAGHIAQDPTIAIEARGAEPGQLLFPDGA